MRLITNETKARWATHSCLSQRDRRGECLENPEKDLAPEEVGVGEETGACLREEAPVGRAPGSLHTPLPPRSNFNLRALPLSVLFVYFPGYNFL